MFATEHIYTIPILNSDYFPKQDYWLACLDIEVALALGFCDRASWANCEVREKTNKMQQLDVY